MASDLRRITGVLCPVALTLITVACGDVYRPVAQVIPGQPPNPAALHFVISVSGNGLDTLNPLTNLCVPSGTPPPCVSGPGTGSRVDVSGDSTLGVFKTGVVPVHAALLPNASKLYVANWGEDTVTENNPSTPTVANTVALQPGSGPVFVHTTENANVYVANYANNTVSVINATSNVVAANVSVGTNPVAMAEMPNAQKLYVANQGSNNVVVINPVDDSVGTTISLAAHSVWAVARADNARIYVLDSNGTVYDIDTLTDSATCGTPSIPCTSPSAGSGSNFLFYDKVANRLYVTNPTNSKVAILDPTVDPPNLVSVIDLSVQPSGAPACASGCAPVSVTGIGDGTRAYVASYQLATCQGLSASFPCVNTQVEVINVGSNSVSKVIPIASSIPVDATNADGCGGTSAPPVTWTPPIARFRLFTTASGGGSTSNFKVYVSQCDAGTVAVIDTFPANSNPADSYSGVNLTQPLSSFAPQQLSISAASQATGVTTYTYSQTSGAGLQVGMSVLITGMADTGNNGDFAITAVGANTFTVSNPSGVSTSGQSGIGAVLSLQNPVFLVAGP